MLSDRILSLRKTLLLGSFLLTTVPSVFYLSLLKFLEILNLKVTDLILAERDRTSPVLWQEMLKEDFGYSIDTSNIPADTLDHDAYLANILSKGPFVLGYTFLFDSETGNQPVFSPSRLSLDKNPGVAVRAELDRASTLQAENTT